VSNKAGNTVNDVAKKEASAAKSAGKGLINTGKTIKNAATGTLLSSPLAIILIVLAIFVGFVILLATVGGGLTSSQMDHNLYYTSVNEEQENKPVTAEENEEAKWEISRALDQTSELAKIIHQARDKERKLLETQIQKEYGSNVKIICETDLTPRLINSKYASFGGGSGSSEINILMVDNSKANERVAARFEKCGCKCTIVFDEASIDADKYDALVIPGGHNVTPSLYGAKKSKHTSGTNLAKDELQIKAVKAFASKSKPILGICRGCQLINVAFGGTIDQGNGVYHKGWHNITFEKGSWVYGIYGKKLNAYHYHKQQIKDVAPGFKVTTWGKKGNKTIIEGIEHETLPIYCTQWHPDMKENGDEGQKVFEAFCQEVRKRKPAASGNTGTSSGSIDGKHVSSNPAIQRAINWAIQTCNDDSFNYGTTGITNRWGCYYCGTNNIKVKKGGGDTRFLKTYMCMSFVTAAYAHGAGDPAILKACQKRKKGITTESFAENNKRFGGCFKLVGKSKDLKASDLEAGDIIVWYDASCSHGHLSMYIGDGDIADAAIHGWGKKTIAIRNNRAGSYLRSNKNDYVMRYIGPGGNAGMLAQANNLPTYDKITTTKTISKETGSIKYLSEKGGYAAQSYAYGGGKFYVMTPAAGTSGSNGYATRYDSSIQPEGVSDVISFGHANGCAYSTADNMLYTVTVSGIGNNKKAVMIDPSSLKQTGTKDLAHGTSSIAFDRITNRFITSSGASNGKAKSTGHLYVYEQDLTSKSGAADIKKKRWATPGDIAAYNGIVYVTIHNGAGANHIDMYNEENGSYLGSYDCPYDEIEGIDIDEGGRIVLLFHAAEGDYLQFTGLEALNGVANSDLGLEYVTKSDLDIMAAHAVSISNSGLYKKERNANETVVETTDDGLEATENYRDRRNTPVRLYWFGKNRGRINYPGDLKSKLRKSKLSDLLNLFESSDSDSGEVAWNLILVNNDNALPDGYSPSLSSIGESLTTYSNAQVDSRIYANLMSMLNDCKDAGYSPKIVSAYRSNKEQQSLYDNAKNKNDTALPGHSEHECGLALDIVDAASLEWADPLVDKQEETDTQKWLMTHCADYGFILRYPKGKQDKTGIIYEPWHYRFVGKDHAKKIMEDGLTLEEYLGSLSSEEKSKEEDTSSGNELYTKTSGGIFYNVVKGKDIKAAMEASGLGDKYEDVAKGNKTIIYLQEKPIHENCKDLFRVNPKGQYAGSESSLKSQSSTNLAAIYALSDNTENVLYDAKADPSMFGANVSLGNGVLALPLPEGSFTVTSHVGKRVSPGGIGSTDHKGVDLGAKTGTPIYASLAGVVTVAGWYGGYGNAVVIESPGDITIIYGHMSKVLVKKGMVTQGQNIGLVGSTGNSTGPHLHFEVHQNGKIVDPEPLLGLR